jgi:protein-disulfide isomerase
MTVFRIRALCWTLIAVGVVISFGVVWRQAVLTGQWPGGDTRLFLALFGGGYGDMLGRPTALPYGQPLAAWSLISYAALGGFQLLGYLLGEEFAFEADFAAFVVSLLSLFVGATLLLTGQAPLCRLCTLGHLNNLALAVLFLRLTGRSATQLIQTLNAGAGYLVTGKTGDPVQARWKLLGIVTVALGALALYQWSVIKVSPESSLDDPQQILAKFKSTTEQEIPLEPDDPTLGPASAPVQLVVFTDFQCPTCRRYAGELHTMVDQYADKLQVVLKHFPLNSACNPGMTIDLHPRACEAAYAAEAARKQEKFWPFHDKLFAADLTDETTHLDSLARDLGLDLERFKADCEDMSTQLKVHSDIALAGNLKLHGTPTLFLNRRLVPSIRPQAVRVLIHQLLQEASDGKGKSGGVPEAISDTDSSDPLQK